MEKPIAIGQEVSMGYGSGWLLVDRAGGARLRVRQARKVTRFWISAELVRQVRWPSQSEAK